MAVGENGIPKRQQRYPKPLTIHSCAELDDLSGLKKLLEGNPSCLNAKNNIICEARYLHPMAQTPMHIAASYNKIDIVKFLLECTGPEKVDLESKNMYGETPLHMAAKNGCSEAARLLLSNGASLKAKAHNGMTPLHLAVFHAREGGECDAVNTLLEYNADCSIKDNEGLTPLNHISEWHDNEKLRDLLNRHIKKQLKIKTLGACGELKAHVVEFEAALSNIVGLQSLKLQLHKWAKGMIFDEKRRALGLSIAPRKVPHMAFLGNPGTGKTMVARVLGKLLHMIGILPSYKVIEVQRTDLVGEFVGHTGPKTRKKIEEAEGGVLLVDEAYRLIPAQKSDDKDYGIEALEEIMSVMDSGNIVVIFAGYCEPMKRVIASNEGFRRRVTKFFTFDDFTPAELAQILRLKMDFQESSNSLLYGFKLHPSCTVQALADLICKGTTKKQREEMNGGLINPLLCNARENLDLRLDFDCCDADSLVTITMDDLEEGLATLSSSS